MTSLNVPQVQDQSLASQDQEGNENKDDGVVCSPRLRTGKLAQTMTIRRKEDVKKGWRAIFLRVCIGLDMLMDLAGSRGAPRANCASAATHNHRSAISKRRCALRESARPDHASRAEAGTDNARLAERWYGMDERRRARGEEGLDEKICV